MRDPSTSAEWQEAVNLSQLLLHVESARAYGLVTGGPEVDTQRCEYIIAHGAQRGIRPNWSEQEREAALAALQRGTVEEE